MKFLYHFRTQGVGAEAVHISGVAGALRRMGHEVVFSSPTGVDPVQSVKQTPSPAPARRSLPGRLAAHLPNALFELLELAYNVPAFFRNAALLHQHAIDAIYERHAFFLFSTALLANRQQLPFIVEVNELVGDERVRAQPLLAPLVRKLDRFVFHSATAIVVVSPHLKRRITALGINPEKILVLPNGVDREDYEPLPDGYEVRKKLGLQRTLTIGFIGGLVPWHKLETLLEVFGDLEKSHPDLRLVLLGQGPLLGELQKLASDLGLADKVLFPGSVGHGEIPAHLAAFDIAVVPHSNAYRSPIKLFEYLAAGRPVVAPGTEPIRSVIKSGTHALLFETNDPHGLQTALTALINDPELRESVGKSGRRHVLTYHTWDNNAHKAVEAIIPRNVRC